MELLDQLASIVTFGIPKELVSCGVPEFTATAARQFLENWNVNHQLSSVAFSYNNWRAEVDVKTVKHLISDSTTSGGDLDTNFFQRPML